MASTYVNNLRLEEIGSGEQSGSWGVTTNTNLEIIGQSTAWGTRAIANASTDNITIADGALDADRSLGLKLTGGGQACTITLLPNTSSKTWFMYNATNSTLTFTCGSGANVAILAGQTKVIATDGLGSGGVVHDLLTAVNLAGVTAVDDLKVGGDILIADAHFIADAAGNEQLVFQTTGSAVNQLEVTNSASSSAFLQGPLLTATGDDSNIDLNLIAKGTGVIAVRGNSASGAVQLNCESNSHGQILQGQPHSAGVTNTMLLPTGANSTLVSLVSADTLTNKTLTSPKINEDVAVTATATEINKLTSSGVLKQAGKETIWVPAAAMYPSTTNPCSDLTQVETTALRPDLKVLDFAAAADDFAQFAIAFPKSWNEGTVTYQPFWTVTGTNTGTMVWQLGGIAVSSDDTINTAFGTLIATTALAHSGTSNDLMVSAESGAVTIAGSPAANDLCFFQINNDASASGQTGAARLLGVKFFFTTDAANDA